MIAVWSRTTFSLLLICLLICLLIGFVPGPVRGQSVDEAPADPTVAPGYAYKVEFEGLKGTDLEGVLRQHADLVRLRKEEPASIWDLRARIRRDLQTFATILRSEGYYGARLSYDLLRRERPIVVKLIVEPGTRFRIDTYSIQFKNADALPAEILERAQQVAAAESGKAARNENIVAVSRRILNTLPNLGYPNAALGSRKVQADHADTTVNVDVILDAGPKSRFGPVSFVGLDQVREGVVRAQVGWERGDLFDQREVAAFRQDLVELNLFASIAIDIEGPPVGEDGDQLPVVVTVTEAEHRTIGVGATYSTSKGFGGEVFWEHRNFRGRAETLILSLKANEQKQSAQADFVRPKFLRKDQRLLLGVEGFRDDTDAFREYGGTLSGAVERKINEHWKVQLGAELSYVDIRDQAVSNDFVLIGLPAIVWYDGSNDLLNPTRGFRFSAEVVPYFTVEGGSGIFTTLDLAGSVYVPLDDNGRIVAAARTHIGFLFGERTANIPASKRFYSGGGASIRGYAFQAVGPLDAEGDPLGGRSVFEVGAELRIRIAESWGLVPFVEGGNVFDSAYPDFSRQLRWGAGLGIRYYTAFGPIRLDVATPINPRPTDGVVEIYVSIGQSF